MITFHTVDIPAKDAILNVSYSADKKGVRCFQLKNKLGIPPETILKAIREDAEKKGLPFNPEKYQKL